MEKEKKLSCGKQCCYEGGQTQAEVAQAIGVSQSVISRIGNRFLETESAVQRPGQGHRRATTPNEDRYLVLTAPRHRNMNATLLQQYLHSATGTTVSTQIVRNRLHSVGLYPRRPMVCQIWRWGVLVYGGISIDGRTDLYISRDGPLTARRYSDEILRPIVVPYAAAIGYDFILMDDNCRPHRANLVEDFFFEEGIVRMEWPTCSPDMNPIEHIWDSLGIRVAGRQPPPQTLQKLERAILEEWDKIPQLVITSLIDSMPQRCSTLLATLKFIRSHSLHITSFDNAASVQPLISPLTPGKSVSSRIRSRSPLSDLLFNPRIILFNSRGGYFTHLWSLLIGRAAKICTRPSDSLALYSSGTHTRSPKSFLNILALDYSSEHLDTLSMTPSLFFENHSPVIFLGISLLSQTISVNCHTVGALLGLLWLPDLRTPDLRI
ncbi:transposable element Tcb2 transposase [Trichonephila clavipes]|nr:transposable element Tcb2 transposase [Trichonephila clavipes]